MHVLLPMTRPALLAFATVSITYHWNEFLWPLMVLNDPDQQVLTLGLASFALGAESGGQWGLISAGSLMVCLPLMVALQQLQYDHPWYATYETVAVRQADEIMKPYVAQTALKQP